MGKTRIMLVDDDVDLSHLTKEILLRHGYEVDAFLDAESAIDFAQKVKPNLILMDVILPRLNGFEAAVILSEDEQLKDVPIIFLTALVSGEKSEDPGLNVNGVIFKTLEKPYEIEALVKIVQEYATG